MPTEPNDLAEEIVDSSKSSCESICPAAHKALQAPHRGPTIYLLPSEALDADSLASVLVFAEIWQALQRQNDPKPFATDSGSKYSRLLASLPQRYSGCPLRCLLPLPQKHRHELLWRKDIDYLLGFLSTRLPTTKLDSPAADLPCPASNLATLYQLFENALGPDSLEFGTGCPIPLPHTAATDSVQPQLPGGHTGALGPTQQGAPQDFLVLLDRHQLPPDWYHLHPPRTPRSSQALFEAEWQGELEARVIAIWDHRPDSGALPSTDLRCIQRATSCVSLLLSCAIQLELLAHLSQAACLLSMATLHLDKQQYGSLLGWEQPIWEQLLLRLKSPTSSLLSPNPIPEPKQAVQQAETEPLPQLNEAQLQALQDQVLQHRQAPALSLYQQANADVKIASFRQPQPLSQFGPTPMIRVAVGTVPAALRSFQQLCEEGSLQDFVQACLRRQSADFLILLHRLSLENPSRAVSFFFYSESPAGIPSPLPWNSRKANYLLVRLQQLFPCRTVYCGGHQNSPKLPELVQLEQADQSLSRKAFMPAFQQSFTALLQEFG